MSETHFWGRGTSPDTIPHRKETYGVNIDRILKGAWIL